MAVMVITSTRWKGKWLVVVDFHTHILPVIDDGSQSISESVTLLRMQMHQGVRAVVATPHFYADQNSPEAFLEKRNRVWRQLAPYLWPELPKVYLGAEVQYFEGIASVEEISLLKIEGSDLLHQFLMLARLIPGVKEHIVSRIGQVNQPIHFLFGIVFTHGAHGDPCHLIDAAPLGMGKAFFFGQRLDINAGAAALADMKMGVEDANILQVFF